MQGRAPPSIKENLLPLATASIIFKDHRLTSMWLLPALLDGVERTFLKALHENSKGITSLSAASDTTVTSSLASCWHLMSPP